MRETVPAFGTDPNYCTKELEYSVTLKDGNPLPYFLRFDALSRSLRIYSTDETVAGRYELRVVASNNEGDEVIRLTVPWSITIINNPYRISENTAPSFATPLKDFDAIIG